MLLVSGFRLHVACCGFQVTGVPGFRFCCCMLLQFAHDGVVTVFCLGMCGVIIKWSSTSHYPLSIINSPQ